MITVVGEVCNFDSVSGGAALRTEGGFCSAFPLPGFFTDSASALRFRFGSGFLFKKVVGPSAVVDTVL